MVLAIDFLRKRMNEEILHNEQLLADAMPHGILILSQNNELLWWNLAAKQLLTLQKPKWLSEILSDEIIHRLFTQTSFKSIETESPNNNNIILSLMIRPYWGDQKLLIIQDVTHNYRIEAMRQDFIANVSHELRTPLTVFHGYLEILQNYQNIDEKNFEEILNHMTSQCQRMERLVQDLLLLSRLESDEPNLESHQLVDISSMLKNIYEDAKLLSGKERHEFNLHLDEHLTLKGQSDELRSAFSNLIYNAVHYTPAKGRIDIHWYQDENGKHMRVDDTGIGIPAKYIPRITQRFYRVDKARPYREKGGTGLGLAIVKHVLLRHNAKLKIKSKVNEGSSFCCSFS